MVERLMAANLNPWIKIAFGQLFSSAGSEKTIAGIAGTASLMFTRFMKKNTLGCFVGKTTLPLEIKGKQMIIFGLDRERRDAVGLLLCSILHMTVARAIAKKRHAEMSDVQAQNIAKQLMLTAADNSQDITDIVLANNNNSSLAIIATIESGDKLTVYQQDIEGKCRHNWLTENLETEEIIAVVYEPIIRYLPPSQNTTNNTTEIKEDLTKIVDELLGQLFGNQDIESES